MTTETSEKLCRKSCGHWVDSLWCMVRGDKIGKYRDKPCEQYRTNDEVEHY